MSGIRNFDEHIKQEFDQYAPQVPQNMWDRIVDERKKRRPAGFWFTLFNNKTAIGIIAVSLMLLIAGGLYLAQSSSNNKQTAVTNNNSQSSIKNNTVASQENSATKNVATANDKTTSINNVEQSNNNNSSVINKNIQPVNTAGNNKQPTNKNRSKIYYTNALSSSVINGEAEDLNNSSDISDKRTIKRKHIYRTTNARSSSTYSDVAVQNDYTTNPDSDNSSVNSTDISDNKNITDAPQNVLAGSLGSRVDKLLLSSSSDDKLKQKLSGITCPECPTVEKDAAGNKRYFEVYIAPDYGIRTLTDTANTAYLERRKESAKFTSGFSMGARYTKVFDNGMSIKAGLNYSQINEKFSYVQGSVVQVTYIIVNGDTTGSYTVVGTRYKTTYNHYRSIDIPLTIGYEFGNGRFHANVNAGIIANIYSWQKGDVLDTNNVPVSITTGKGSPLYQFKTNLGLGATGGVAFYYKINDQVHFMAEPYLRYNFQPMNAANLTLRQKYTTVGLRLGLRFDLPNKIGSAFK